MYAVVVQAYAVVVCMYVRTQHDCTEVNNSALECSNHAQHRDRHIKFRSC